MKTSGKIATAVLVVAMAGLGAGTVATAKGGFGGYCDQHPRMMMGKRMGMQGGPGWRFAKRELDLTEQEVRTLTEARLIRRGNDRLKVGKIAKKDDQIYRVDIVTVDDSLVRQLEIDKDTGRRAGKGQFKRGRQMQ